MKPSRWAIVVLMLVLVVLLSGCINIKQEYWLNGDGSAKVGMDIGMSESLLAMGNGSGSKTQTNPFDDLKKEYNTSNPKLKNVQVKEYKENDMQHFSVTFDVADFQDFLNSQKSSQDQLNITLTKKPDGSIRFRQVTRLDNSTGGGDKSFDPKTMAPMFKDMYWMVTVHVPELTSTNGTKIDGSTAQWKIPMLDVFAGKAPAELTLDYNPRGNGGVAGGAGSNNSIAIVLVVVVLLLAGAGAAYYFLVLRKRPVPAVYPQAQPGPYGSYIPQQPPQGGQMPPQGGQMAAQFPPQPQSGVPQPWAPQNQTWTPQAGQLPPQAPTTGAWQPPAPQIPPQGEQASTPPTPYPQYPQYPQYPPAGPQTGYYTPPASTPPNDPKKPAS